ncbi:RNA polymerase I-specific transcription-initiation factor-domain-containing protein [Triangularia verruculosa]|uniref:RNA polymerase I-specific transcription-initiation factor-domain-containing protein n=1 Tax=Triangularia verruculosa TaxID=2587418 RepID=A0AAN6XLH7_9PEZI|nr:RNA polymerase I-specific transcription-initiation factor-domain-containing protein [Triangularia verruculosa]
MDEKRRTGHSAGRSRTTNANRRHHTDGLVGRLSYTPAQQDGAIGELRRNRVKDETPHFQQVTPFSQWCPPSKVHAPSSNLGGPWRIARSQGNWLTEYLPEASITEEELEGIFLEEIASAKDHSDPSLVSTTSLFSIGEIADVRFESKGDATLSVMAVSSGVSGNVLRLVSLARKEWLWQDSDVTARTKAPDARFEGDWCQDALPISLIKFAVNASGSKNSKGRAVDTIRWLLVQKETSTTICGPEVRDLPMPTPGIATESGPASQIFINPLVTIPMTQTGGSPQTDVCFIRQPEKHTPRLAIIDQCGYWSIWDITGRRDLRPKTLTPILRMCGNMLSGSIPKLPSSSANYGRPHKVLFLEVEPKQSISEEIDLPRKPFLLLNTDQALQLFDIESDNAYPVPLPTFGADHQRILEVVPARLDPAHFFLLTNKSLLWVAVRKGVDDIVDVDTLAICPHQKDSTDPTLRIEVSAGTFVNNVPACFVCVWSSQDTEMNIFWFLFPDPGTPVRYGRELVSLKSPSHFVGLGMLPVGRKLGRGGNITPSGKRMREAALKFFQFLTLSQDMEVSSALCVWSDDKSVEIPDPEVMDKGNKGNVAEKQLLDHLGRKFVVPDGFDELTALGKRKVEEPDAGEKKPQKPKLNDYSLAAQRLAMAPHEWPRRTLHLEQIEPATGQDLNFLRSAVEKEKDDGYMPRHTVLELAKPSHKSDDGIIALARTWADIQPELQDDQDDKQAWLYPPEASRPVPGFNPDDMAQNLNELFPKSRKRAAAPVKNQRTRVLQKMAAEMFLSNISISAVPPSWSAPLNNETQSQSQYSSSQPAFPPSSPLKSHHHHFHPPTPDLDNDHQQEDLLALRLRKYATIPVSPSRKGEPSLGLSSWVIGADPDSITWNPGQDLEAEKKKDKRLRKIQARRERAERISQRYFGEESSFVEGSASQQLPSVQPSSSQMLFSQGAIPNSPAFLRSPARRVVRPASPLRREYRMAGRESLSQGGMGLGGGGSQETPGRQQPTRSQVLPGIFGGRESFGVGGMAGTGSGLRVRESLSPFKKRNKQKRKSEGRLSGFR